LIINHNNVALKVRTNIKWLDDVSTKVCEIFSPVKIPQNLQEAVERQYTDNMPPRVYTKFDWIMGFRQWLFF